MTRSVSRRPATLPYALSLAIGGAIFALSTLAAQAGNRPVPPSPDVMLGPLFNDVQRQTLPRPENLCRCDPQ
jgi:alpha,alpha-trehalase